MTTDIWRRLARTAVRLYPRPWRRRYGDEVLSLLDASAPGPRVVADLALGALRERSAVLGVLVWFAAVLVRAFALTTVTLGSIAVLFVLLVGPILSHSHRFDWSEWASRRIFDLPYAATAGMAMWVFFSMEFSLPILLLLLWPPIRRRRPRLARVIFAAAFCGFSIWLGHLNQQLAMLMCGWLIAVKVFPVDAPLPTATAAKVAASSVESSTPAPPFGLRQSFVLLP